MVYLDHAATTPVHPEVLQAMLPYFNEQYANASSSYGSARAARSAIDCARRQIAALIGAMPEEIYFTSCGSEADNWALTGVLHASAPDKTHIITSQIEHHAILHTCDALSRQGYSVSYLPVDRQARVHPVSAATAITPETACISIMMANNEVGTIQPIREMADIAHQHGILFHTDAVQAVGHIPVDVNQLGVDLLSMSAHKFFGPKGIGALYIRKGTHIKPLIHGGAQEKGLRGGTENTPAIVGMGAAAQIAKQRMHENAEHTARLRDEMISVIQAMIPSAHVNALDAQRLPGHVHLTIDGADSALLLMQLDMQGIAASSGSACAAGATERSHVLRAMGYHSSNQADLRFSLAENNTIEDVHTAVKALARLLQP